MNSCLAGKVEMKAVEGCGGGHGYFDANAEAKRLGLSPKN